MNRYLQCLLKNKGKYQLCWIPEFYAQKGYRLKIQGDLIGEWEVKEVYDTEVDEVRSSGQVVYYNLTNPYLDGAKLQERLQLYRKLKRFVNIEVV